MTADTISTNYRDQVLKVEPKGIEPISAAERHGSTRSAFTLWFGANAEFATLVTGVLATALFGLSFTQSVIALLIGNLIGSVLLGWVSTYGPRLGVPQLVQSRAAFGYFGNFLPGALNFIAGFSWFAVNSVLGVFALEKLFSITFGPALAIMVVVQVAVAVLGHNLIQVVERWLVVVLTAVFVMVSCYGFAHGHLSAPFNPATAGTAKLSGAFVATVSVAFSYVLGWIPYASDYTRYLPAQTSRRSLFLHVAVSMLVSGLWLEVLGAAVGTTTFVSVPTDLTGLMPHAAADVTLVGIALGTITANVLNIYSGALSSLVLDIPLRRWGAALVVGAAGTGLSWYAGRSNFYQHYEVFLFLLGYWAAPWLAVLLVDLATRTAPGSLLYDRRHRIGAGFLVWLVAIGVSVPFMNQPGTSFIHFVGPFASAHPQFGDITYYVSFVVAALLYGLVLLVFGRRRYRSDAASAAANAA